MPAQIYVCRSGSAADTQNMTAYIQWFLHQHQMELTEPLVEVKTAARLAQQLVYQNKVRNSPSRAAPSRRRWSSHARPLHSAPCTHGPAARFRTGSCGRPDTRGLLQNMLQAGLIVAGWDKREGGSVYALPLGGTLIKVPFSIGAAWQQLPGRAGQGQRRRQLSAVGHPGGW